MQSLARVARWLFGLNAWIYALTIPMIWTSLTTLHTFATSPFARVRVLMIASALVTALIALNTSAWWTLRSGKPSGQILAILASVVNLPFIGVGTLTGIVGLIAFIPRKNLTHAAITKKAAAPLPGDGTSKITKALAAVIPIAVLLLAGELWNRWRQAHGLEFSNFYTGLLLLQVAILVNVFLHESGHVLAGWAMEMKLFSLIVGPFQWKTESGVMRFKFSWPGFAGGGAAGMVPLHLKDLQRRRLVLIAGGPFASLMSGMIFSCLALAAPGSPWEGAWDFLSMCASLGWMSAVSSMIPLRPEQQYSDGAQIYQMLKKGPWADVHAAFSIVSSSLATPLRPARWDRDLLSRAAGFLTTGEQALLLRLYLVMHHADRGEWPEALERLRQAEQLYSQAGQALDADSLTEFVVMHALVRRDPVATRWWWQQMELKKNSRHRVDYWKARTAWLWMEGQPNEAWHAAAQSEAFAMALPSCGAYDYDRTSVVWLQTALQTKVPVAV